jgi:dual specificity phosphatase 12
MSSLLEKRKGPGLKISLIRPELQAQKQIEIEEKIRINDIIREGVNTAHIVYTDPLTGNNLYVGGIGCLTKYGTLFSQEISAIISMVPSEVKSPNHLELIIPDDCWVDIADLFDTSNTFIKTHLAHGNVLVHCQAGISRSVTIVAAFIMNSIKCSATDAIEQIKAIRIQANPNSGFMRQLSLYQP